MAKFKIVPTNIITGATAPYFVERIEDEHRVERIAKTLSPLFKDARWQPSVSKLFDNKKRKFNYKN